MNWRENTFMSQEHTIVFLLSVRTFPCCTRVPDLTSKAYVKLADQNSVFRYQHKFEITTAILAEARFHKKKNRLTWGHSFFRRPCALRRICFRAFFGGARRLRAPPRPSSRTWCRPRPPDARQDPSGTEPPEESEVQMNKRSNGSRVSIAKESKLNKLLIQLTRHFTMCSTTKMWKHVGSRNL